MTWVGDNVTWVGDNVTWVGDNVTGQDVDAVLDRFFLVDLTASCLSGVTCFCFISLNHVSGINMHTSVPA